MRVIFLGAGTLTVMTARLFVEQGHEVVIIEKDPEKIEELSDELDCGFLCGDGSRPAMIEEAGPGSTDILFALSDSDQDNILASLVARSLGVDRVVTRIEDPELEVICRELGLQDTIIPDAEVARALSEMASGIDRAPLAGALKSGLRFYTLAVTEKQAGSIADLELPESTRIIAVTSADASRLADDETDLEEKDRVLMVVEEKELENLRKRFESDPES